MAKKDPFMLDPEDGAKMEKQVKGKSSGVICRKRHGLGNCEYCDFVAKLYQQGTKEAEDRASKLAAKVRFYLNVVFPDNPDKLVLMEIGKKAGDRIIYKWKKDEWNDIAHPKAGKGRELKITKTKGDMGFNSYDVDPSLNKADWDIPSSVLNNLYDLDNILELLNDESVEIFQISSLKMDESITFRICPYWKWKEEERNLKIMVPVWRHWNTSLLSEDEEDSGEVSVPWETSDEPDNVPDFPDKPEEDEQPKSSKKKPACFGDEDCYDEDDDQCKECAFFKKCGAAVEG